MAAGSGLSGRLGNHRPYVKRSGQAEMPLKSAASYAVAAVLMVLAIIIAVVFDSPTSVWLLLGIVAVGVAWALASSRSTR